MATEREEEKKREVVADSSLFSDPSLQQVLVEDPLFRVLKQWWRPLFMVVGAVAAIMFLQYSFQSTREQSRVAAADVYALVRQEYNNFVATQQQQPAEDAGADEVVPEAEDEDVVAEDSQASDSAGERNNIKPLKAAMRSLEERIDPYGFLPELYRLRISQIEPNVVSVPERDASILRWRDYDVDASERFFSELAALASARAMLGAAQEIGAVREAGPQNGPVSGGTVSGGTVSDSTVSEDGVENWREAREALTELASEGHYVATEALIALSRTASSDEEKERARELISTYLAAHPYQRELLEEEYERL